jgi:hypothetical protein
MDGSFWFPPSLIRDVPDWQIMPWKSDGHGNLLTWVYFYVVETFEHWRRLSGGRGEIYIELRYLWRRSGLIFLAIVESARFTSPPYTSPVFSTSKVTWYAGSWSLLRVNSRGRSWLDQSLPKCRRRSFSYLTRVAGFPVCDLIALDTSKVFQSGDPQVCVAEGSVAEPKAELKSRNDIFLSTVRKNVKRG